MPMPLLLLRAIPLPLNRFLSLQRQGYHGNKEGKGRGVELFKGLEYLPNLSEDGKITEKVILKIHRLLTKDDLENPADSGVYRNRQVVIGNRITGVITFRPPDSKDVPILMAS